MRKSRKRRRGRNHSNFEILLLFILLAILIYIGVKNAKSSVPTFSQPSTKIIETISSPQTIPTQTTISPVKKERRTEKLTEVTIKLKNEPSTTNAKVASKFVDGIVLKPGEVFSYNKIIGERTPEKGFVYAPMPILKNGEKTTVQSMGSGICRLSVAIATASDRLNFPNYGRVSHTFTPYYIATNKSENLSDATVFWPDIDNKFKNTKDYDILINTSVDDNYVLHCIFSKITWQEVK